MRIHYKPSHGVTQGIVSFLKKDAVFRSKGISIYHSVRSIGDPIAQDAFRVWAGDLWFAMDAKHWLSIESYDTVSIEGEMATYSFYNCAVAALVVHFIGV